jgi:ribosomal protein RSM22 (predicted rRNA methylase)
VAKPPGSPLGQGRKNSMRLPRQVQEAIEFEVARFDHRKLARASAELTRRYRGEITGSIFERALDRAAYLTSRLPATFAAARSVFSEIRRLAAQTEIASVLDLGSGPGTAAWAVADVNPELQRATLIESDPAWIEIGQVLAGHSSQAAIRQAQWVQRDLRDSQEWPQHDLVVISYALGELPAGSSELFVRRALQATKKFLVVIEPGTVRGFGVIHQVRSALIAANVGILAPCPHRLACPMAAAGDWCHFSQRVERSSLHRQIKGGRLPYEDEKFSYIVAAKECSRPPGAARIVRHPQRRSGHIQVELCTARGIERRTITRSQGTDYRRARQAEWGDLWAD